MTCHQVVVSGVLTQSCPPCVQVDAVYLAGMVLAANSVQQSWPVLCITAAEWVFSLQLPGLSCASTNNETTRHS